MAAPKQLGPLVAKLPLPPGALPTLWNNEARFRRSYLDIFPGYYHTVRWVVVLQAPCVSFRPSVRLSTHLPYASGLHGAHAPPSCQCPVAACCVVLLRQQGDAATVDNFGYIDIMSRTDDVMNVAGHRLSTGAMEAAIATHDDVAEVAVIGPADAVKGQVPVGLVVLKDGTTTSHEEVVQQVVAIVRKEVGPIASFRQVAVVDRLPKTRSGKTLRGTMKARVCGCGCGCGWCVVWGVGVGLCGGGDNDIL